MGSEKWEVGSGKWEVGSGKWEVGSEKWEVGSEKWEVQISDLKSPNEEPISVKPCLNIFTCMKTR